MKRRVGRQPQGDAGRQLVDSAVHLAVVGVGGGMVYGALMPRVAGGVLTSGTLFGLSVWAIAFGFLAPRPGDHTIASPRDMA